jgi:hypothetical protein
MKKILNFSKFNEAIIIPHDEIDTTSFINDVKDVDTKFISYEDINKITNKYGFDIVDYKTFYNELPSDEARKEAPGQGEMVFALLNPINKKPRLVINIGHTINTTHLISISNEISNILRHEFIHSKQDSKRTMEYKLPNPNDKQSYYSNKDEVMAFSYSIAQELYDNNKTSKQLSPTKLIKFLHKVPLYVDIRNSINRDALKRYHKYIYQYLEQMVSKIS